MLLLVGRSSCYVGRNVVEESEKEESMGVKKDSKRKDGQKENSILELLKDIS